MVTNTKAYHWGKRQTQTLLKVDFIRFGIVGAIGFVVTLVLSKTIFSNLEVFLAIFLSSEGGMLSNFFFHEKWTYNQVDHHSKSVWLKFWHFQLSSLSGIIIMTLLAGLGEQYLGLPRIISLAIAAGITMFWNYFWTKFFIFKGTTPAILLNPEETVPEKIK